MRRRCGFPSSGPTSAARHQTSFHSRQGAGRPKQPRLSRHQEIQIMAVTIVEKVIGGRTLRFETGRVAKLASGAVIASYADTWVLATCVRANPRAGIDFFPLTSRTRRKSSRCA
jgi:hypothetical protein